MTIPPDIRKALRIVIVSQCVGLIATLLFNNGFMLAYFSRLGLADHLILFLFALIPLVGMVLTLPLAFAADRTGKKRMGGIGIVVSIAGFLMLVAAPFLPGLTVLLLTTGTLVFAAGNAAMGSSWFALLSPIVPEEIRGRWFGQMRTAWQMTGILFSLAVAVLFRWHSSLPLFQLILLICGLLLPVRLFLYMKIPELEPVHPSHDGFSRSLKAVFQIPGYLSFCAYIFLLSFMTGAVPGVLGLLEKGALGFNDSLLVVMGNLLSIGAIAGFLLGGKMVDRIGTKPVFLTGHVVFSATLAGILLRGFIPLPTVVTIGGLAFLFGAIQGATGIASTSELLALIPPENKSLSTGFNITLIAAGTSIAGLFSGQLLQLNVLHSEWTLFGQTLSEYDTILAGFMMMILLIAVTLGLVPTIRHLRSQWLPQNR
ncbi:MAG: MFS transporter [Kiritimatiellales bacterium]